MINVLGDTQAHGGGNNSSSAAVVSVKFDLKRFQGLLMSSKIIMKSQTRQMLTDVIHLCNL